MKIRVCPYQLNPKSFLGSVAAAKPRQGALLKVIEGDFVGYADLHPWWELGDLPLDQQLEKLRNGRLTALTQRSLELAQADGEARARGFSLWDFLKVPSSHSLATDLSQVSSSLIGNITAQGFKRLKVKLGRQPREEVKKLRELQKEFLEFDLKLRLDFNSSLNQSEFEGFLDAMGEARQILDFVEDPFPYDPISWKGIQDRWQVRLALDRIPLTIDWKSSQGAFSVLVHKPAVQKPEWAFQIAVTLNTQLVVTSYLDHPVGQLSAAWVASQLLQLSPERIEICGLLSHTAYEANAFSDEIRTLGPILQPPVGRGLGMDRLLENLKWLELEEV